jgi:hypothetical protein
MQIGNETLQSEEDTANADVRHIDMREMMSFNGEGEEGSTPRSRTRARQGRAGVEGSWAGGGPQLEASVETVKKPRRNAGARDGDTSDPVFSSGNSRLFDSAGDVLTPRKVALSRHGPRQGESGASRSR